MFFYYQKTVTGKWTPVKSINRPGVSPEGRKRIISSVVDVTDTDCRNMSLDELSLRYPVTSLIKEE